MSNTEKLLPCPFCGNNEIKISQGRFGYSSFCCSVKCNCCGARVEKEDDIYDKPKSIVIDSAIDTWNRRVSHG
jgi:hypothetical protein